MPFEFPGLPLFRGSYSNFALLTVWLGWVVLAPTLNAATVTEPADGKALGESPTSVQPEAASSKGRAIYIREYRIQGGAHLLPQAEADAAVYPFLGPGRTADDVEQARAALEKAFRDKGYQAVSVQIPPQQARRGIVVLQVIDGKVGRLRITGSRYFSLEAIRKGTRSLAEGKAVDFNEVNRDIVALNQCPDRTVTPTLRAGAEPGTVDIDLNVKDTLPLHGSLELNDRYSLNTTPLRLNGALSYDNIWQREDLAGLSFQLAPERLEDAEVFSAYYSAHVPDVSWLSLMLQGTKQDSNVSTLGGLGSSGKGEVVGVRAVVTLPREKEFYQTLNFGLDWKHFNNGITVGGIEALTPITYFPFTTAYSASWVGKAATTELNASLNFHLRGMGSNPQEFDSNRYDAGGDYLYIRSDLSHTHDLPGGFQLYGKVQGQAADQPLVSSEQFNGGGLGTVRGYLESEALGDNAIFGSVELRSPSLNTWVGGGKVDEWRLYLFTEGGVLTLNNPLPEQASRFDLASFGIGSRIRFLNHLNGSLDVGVPLISQAETSAFDLLFTFRLWAEF
jgi:hemolysin activation/secretion protein